MSKESFQVIGGGRGTSFPSTRWSLIASANGGSELERSEALADLCQMYWYPLYAFIRHCGHSASDAEDLTQGFFSHLLSNDRIAYLSTVDGRLRSYLLGALKNFLCDQLDRQNAIKRGGGRSPLPIEVDSAEMRYALASSKDRSPEQIYEQAWARSLIARAFERLREEYRLGGKLELFDALEGHVSVGGSKRPHAEIANELGMQEGAVRAALHRLRKRFAAILDEEILETVASREEIEGERNYLCQLFS